MFKTKRFFRFSIGTVLWLTFSAACFMGGIRWEQQREQLRWLLPNSTVSGKKVRLTVGQSVIISRPSAIPRAVVNNPEFVHAVTVSPNQIQLAGLGPGRTQLSVWDSNGKATTYSINVRPSAHR